MIYRLQHSKLLIFILNILIISGLIVACQSPKINNTEKVAVNPACIQNYDKNRDYFPDKITITRAKGFSIEYHNNYKTITINNPWKEAKTGFKYVLLQCGTPAPKDIKDSELITVPINSVVSLSTTHLPHLAKLGVVDKLVGVSDTKIVNTSEVVEKIKAGTIANVGSNASVNVERILELNPELVITYGTGNVNNDSYPKLLEAGLKVVINAEYMEDSPLGRSEWLKFTALFFNREKEAEQIFGEVAKKYDEIATKVKTVKERPTVFVGFNFKGTWYMPGGNSYAAKYLEDAGANYLWSNDKSSGSLPLSFEAIIEGANNADFWLNFSQKWKQKKEILAEDSRYGDFKAVKTGNLYNNNLRVNENSGNDYWEGGISNPDVVLSDLIKIFHPEILAKHELVFYRRVN
ncbi:MAG: ABC transporter substrate-binding protein [Cyanomargarita calcarea GSE-NOS-MK-12-04C]|jgi:iron complex transport system substrate-binding protein|uniref:ABC transporter substrate-binding protein n=1 Tax=Cyanomargarita calcarea GSE-NOS-MK-12-04C TaxID=2839659 RepID=A0A951QGZ2_9CYAN|nr:ABC transporter substrate-binding protein [Cyanomargarita calcarea GSE-NOS-MK-12-04C]